MKMVSDWRRVVAVSWSFWAQALGLAAMIVPELIYIWAGIDLDPRTLWLVGVGLLLVGMAGRLIEQTGSALRSWLRLVAVAALVVMASVAGTRAETPTDAAVMAVSVPLIARFEGKRNAAYLDIVGVPTICYGSTRGVKIGMVMTDQECTALLRAEALEYYHGWREYLLAETVRERLTPQRAAAFTSLAFNVGIRAAGQSTATRRLNAGNIAGACEALTWWDRAGNRRIRGLTARRLEEKALCLA